eukprot:TRINITY_DN5457_c0_g1_i1.p1 TRINITY_DN5457_c0_g1~~TRINITY_DN5457_c0_g1_i1.p1  ORF type:complete len:480 (-),score=61.15 TRINITY_DN5457_c0_g1_i1:172-1611(-)
MNATTLAELAEHIRGLIRENPKRDVAGYGGAFGKTFKRLAKKEKSGPKKLKWGVWFEMLAESLKSDGIVLNTSATKATKENRKEKKTAMQDALLKQKGSKTLAELADRIRACIFEFPTLDIGIIGSIFGMEFAKLSAIEKGSATGLKFGEWLRSLGVVPRSMSGKAKKLSSIDNKPKSRGSSDQKAERARQTGHAVNEKYQTSARAHDSQTEHQTAGASSCPPSFQHPGFAPPGFLPPGFPPPGFPPPGFPHYPHYPHHPHYQHLHPYQHHQPFAHSHMGGGKPHKRARSSSSSYSSSYSRSRSARPRKRHRRQSRSASTRSSESEPRSPSFCARSDSIACDEAARRLDCDERSGHEDPSMPGADELSELPCSSLDAEREHDAPDAQAEEMKTWLLSLDRGHGALVQYLDRLQQEFTDLQELVDTVLVEVDAPSVVKCVDPIVFDALEVRSLGHKLLLARGIRDLKLSETAATAGAIEL